MKRRLQWRERTLRVVFAVAAVLVPVGVLGPVEARASLPVEVHAMTLSGARYSTVEYVPMLSSTATAAVQAVRPKTPNATLDTVVAGFIDAETARFQAALPATPAYKGFLHQLRIVPLVTYVQGDKVSLTLDIEEYHPSQAVSVRFVSWLADGGSVSETTLSDEHYNNVQALLPGLPADRTKLADQRVSYGLLPSYQVRFYRSGALENSIQGTRYIDLPIDKLPAFAYAYKNKFFSTYPETVSADDRHKLNEMYDKAQVRQYRLQTDCTYKSCVALTFDDGPHAQQTPRVLSVLKQYKVPATFFELGNQVQRHPELTQQIVAEGHEVENHTYAHADLVKLKHAGLIRKQIDDAQGALAAAGVHAEFLRPPYGSVDDHVRRAAQMPLVFWNVDAQEWRAGTGASAIAASITSQARPGAIILMHDTQAVTADALPTIIADLQQRDYTFVTVKELLQIDGAARGDFYNR